MNERRAVVVMDDPAQVAAWNSRLSPAPEGVDADLETTAWNWLDSRFANVEAGHDPSDRDYSPDEMIDAFIAGAALSRPPAEQVRIREAEYARGIKDAAKEALRFETADWESYDPRTIAYAIRALTPSPERSE